MPEQDVTDLWLPGGTWSLPRVFPVGTPIPQPCRILSALSGPRHVSPGALPQKAKLAPVQVAEMGRESVRLVTYSPYDPIELPKVLFDLLAAFDGRSLDEVRRNILEDFGFELEPDLIQRLLDFGILSQES